MATRAMTSPAASRAEPPRPVAWFALMALGLAVLIVVALARGMPEDVPWYLAHVLPLMAVVAFVSTRFGGRAATAALVGFAVALPTLAWAVGFGPFDPWNEPPRLQLFTQNPNLLAADLVAVFWAAALLRPKGPWVWLLPMVAVAVMLTGSRTALLALSAATVAWALLPSTPVRVRGALAAGGLLVAGFVTYANHQVREDAANVNLVPQSSTFDDRAWTTYSDGVATVTPRATEGPWPGTWADRIRATSGTSRLTLYQSFGRSVEGTSYVASVYLRADVPQTVVVSNHLARTPCTVATEWTRCVTPAGTGNGQSATQFRFETVEPGASFDLYAYGPQYEIGTEATAYVERGGGLLPSSVVTRFGTWPVSLDAVASTREGPAQAGWRAFVGAPWLGAGVGWTRDSPVGPGSVVQVHAHNLMVERLAVDGLVGFLGWALLAAALLLPITRAFGARAAPWFLALAVLNTWDMTWFHSGSYFSTAIIAGRAICRSIEFRHIPAPSLSGAPPFDDRATESA